MTDRELMQQALEAFKLIDDVIPFPVGMLAMKNLRDRLAQPEQEPVAWMHKFIRDNIITHNPADINRHPERWTPLYTAPRPWQGLTSEEIWACNVAPADHHVECHICVAHQNVLDFAEAIGAKLKEKNT